MWQHKRLFRNGNRPGTSIYHYIPILRELRHDILYPIHILLLGTHQQISPSYGGPLDLEYLFLLGKNHHAGHHIFPSRVLTWDDSHAFIREYVSNSRKRRPLPPQMNGHLQQTFMPQLPRLLVLLALPELRYLVQRHWLHLDLFLLF